MANITAAMVKDLRERTGLGMMDCKKALSEAEGDIEKAIDDLRKASGMKAAKKASRVAADGIVITKVASDGNYGVILEVNSETDFVARDESFLSFANGAVEAAFANKDADVPAILASGLEDQREKLVQKIGENINIRRVARLQFADASIANQFSQPMVDPHAAVLGRGLEHRLPCLHGVSEQTALLNGQGWLLALHVLAGPE